ncbi:MAG: hypothetical protein FWF79_01710, partial [Defluviitaleaceae bacterium]|nr:hypothetical protein [Defluviitaleaceae bacterium]
VLAAERTFGSAVSLGHEGELLPIDIDEVLAGQGARDGYILAPTIFGLAGIDTLSRFVLRTPEEYAVGSFPRISVDGQSQPAFTREDNNTFIITPAVALTPNAVYVFRLARPDGEEVTWAFQTAKRFEITGTMPRDRSTNVPVRTGVEINFSFGENIDISRYFSIYPHTEGEFINRGSSAIFVPSEPLQHATVYTVIISDAIGISADRVFLFETAPAVERVSEDWASRVHFSTAYVEFPTFATPVVHFWLNYRWGTGRPSIEMTVYRMDERAQAIAAVNRLSRVHWWSHIFDYVTDTSGLTRVFSETLDERQTDESHWNEVFVLPDNLPPGFYLVNAETDSGGVSQAIVQITDIAVQVIADNERTLVWVNDMHTGGAAAGATVFDAISRESFSTSDYGIAVVERGLNEGDYLIVNASGTESIVFVNPMGFQHFWHRHHWEPAVDWDMGWDDLGRRFDMWPQWGMSHANSQYWTALQPDRTLFQRDDTLHLWGFVQNRRVNENIPHVTAVLTEHTWWGWGDEPSTPLHRQNIPVAYGAFSGEIALPFLEPGSYELAVYHGDILLNSIFFTVADYVTPPYQLRVTASHAAVFAGEEVTFTASTEFFEGTPVPDLDISYSFWGWELRQFPPGRARTDSNGVVSVSAQPTAGSATVQGVRTLEFHAEATLPEIGWTFVNSNVRVFVNDISVRPRASREGGDATLSVDVNNITIDRLNNGTAEHRGDFLCEPVAGQRLSVEIVEHYWEAVRAGQFYCHVLRQVVPRYRHVHRVNSLETFEIVTDALGNATRDFTVPNREKRSYEARVTTTDGNGRRIRHYVFIGQNWEEFFRAADDAQLFLYGANPEGYDIGDRVELTIMRGTEAVSSGNFLFVVVQSGILSYHIGANPLEITFGEMHVPNAQVFAYHFNGHTFNAGGPMSQRLRFNPANHELLITVETCSETYRPGDSPTFTITTTDLAGNPRAANVNLSLVDEALFALMNYDADTLAMLYANIDDNLSFSIATHPTFASDGMDWDAEAVAEEGSVMRQGNFGGGRMLAGDAAMGIAPPASAPFATAEMEMSVSYEAVTGAADTHIRERFQDTAMFAAIRTNENGTATLTVQLPDNITTWRATASAICEALYAGNTVESIRVTQPMFLHYTLSNIFLTGDTPEIGVNVFGTALAGDNTVQFSVWREDFPNEIRTATGAAFERVNIPLWEKAEEGHGAIIVHAEVLGYSDAVRHGYQVVGSHRLVESATFYSVTPQTVFATDNTGLTNITFADHGRGQFLHDLLNLRHSHIWWNSVRVEDLVARREANALVRRHFPDVQLFGTSGNFDVLDYQTASGGMSVLPYGDAELEVTIKLLPFIAEEINLHALRGYLQNIAETSTADNRILALYGLAILGEPVLLELQRYAALENLSVRNAAYIGLGLAALNDKQAANDLWQRQISPNIQAIAPYYRVTEGVNRRQIADATSATALLAATLGLPEASGLFNYAANARLEAITPRLGHQRPDTAQINAYLLLNLERLLFIQREIENHSGRPATITYTIFGETITRDLGHGGQYTLRIPAANFGEFNLVSVTGEVGAVSITRTPLEDIEPIENHITVSRQFFRAGTTVPVTSFAQYDLIRVQITVDYSAIDITGTYVITDYLPAGLTFVEHSARIALRNTNPGHQRAWATSDGRQVTFFDHNGRFNRVHTYYYYARVVNPGSFRAEGTVVQSFGVREYIVVGDDAVITVR